MAEKYTLQTIEGQILEVYPATGIVLLKGDKTEAGRAVINSIGEEETSGIAAEVQTALDAKQPLDGNGFTVASAPDATTMEGRAIYVSNGAAGSPCAAVSNGTDWLQVIVGAAISAT
jgi:hypothetical protein